MIAIACLILTAAGCYFSYGLGTAWWLAWLAPVPALWLAFGATPSWQAFLVAWGAVTLGLTSLVHAYFHVLPVPVLAIDILCASLPFALAVMGARRVNAAFASRSG